MLPRLITVHVKAMSCEGGLSFYFCFSLLSVTEEGDLWSNFSPADAAATVTRAVDSRSNLKIMQRHFAPRILH